MLLRKMTCALVAFSGLVAACLTATPAQATSDDLPGCPPGYACLYRVNFSPSTPPQYRYPRDKWFYYGTYSFLGYWDDYRLVNNQTDGARVRLCVNSTDCTPWLQAGQSQVYNMSPYNYIELAP